MQVAMRQWLASSRPPMRLVPSQKPRAGAGRTRASGAAGRPPQRYAWSQRPRRARTETPCRPWTGAPGAPLAMLSCAAPRHPPPRGPPCASRRRASSSGTAPHAARDLASRFSVMLDAPVHQPSIQAPPARTWMPAQTITSPYPSGSPLLSSSLAAVLSAPRTRAHLHFTARIYRIHAGRARAPGRRPTVTRSAREPGP